MHFSTALSFAALAGSAQAWFFGPRPWIPLGPVNNQGGGGGVSTVTTTVTSTGIPAAVAQSASNACAPGGQPTPYFDAQGNPAFCGPYVWGGGNLPATTLCP